MSSSAGRSARGAFGLQRSHVTSTEIYESETAKIFNRNWICIGRESDLDNGSNCWPLQFENHLLLLVRNSDDKLNCFHNICRHRGSRLVDPGNCSKLGSKITCPYHAWSYDRDGQLIAAPNMKDVEGFDQSQFGLKSVGCRQWNGFVWINIDCTEGFDEFIQPLTQLVSPWGMGALVTHETIEYNVKANWKLIFQNYSECYHCPTVHPVLNQLTPYKGSSNAFESGAILGGPMMLAEKAKTMSMDGSAAGALLPDLTAEQEREVGYFTIFPTAFISTHPDYVLVHRLERMGVDQTRVVCEFLFHPDAIGGPSFSPAGAIEFWDMTNKQDWHVCELAQLGMSADGYEPGPYSNLESVVAAFDRHYREKMD